MFCGVAVYVLVIELSFLLTRYCEDKGEKQHCVPGTEEVARGGANVNEAALKPTL